jgi:hypothetical protein
MRLITFVLSSGIVLTWIPGASAQKITHSQGIVVHCPMHEGYIDCAHHAQPTAYSSAPAPSQRAYGSLWQWQPRRARQPRSAGLRFRH